MICEACGKKTTAKLKYNTLQLCPKCYYIGTYPLNNFGPNVTVHNNELLLGHENMALKIEEICNQPK